MSFTLCISGAIVSHAGRWVNSDASISGVLLSQFSDEAEGFICANTKYDWITNYALVPASYKPVLAAASSNLAAIDLIKWDTSGYPDRGTAEDLINVCHDKASRAITFLKDNKVQSKLGAT